MTLNSSYDPVEEAAYRNEYLAEQWFEQQDFGTGDAGFENMLASEKAPASGCPHKCEVELDGRCPHGFDSALVVMGLMFSGVTG